MRPGHHVNRNLNGLENGFHSGNVRSETPAFALRNQLDSVGAPGGRIFDSDGEGLPDTVDNSYTQKLNGFTGSNPVSEFNPDSDGDCFDDNFEVNHRSEGFDPTTPDVKIPGPFIVLLVGVLLVAVGLGIALLVVVV